MKKRSKLKAGVEAVRETSTTVEPRRVAITGLPGPELQRFCSLLSATTVDSFSGSVNERDANATVLCRTASLNEIEEALQGQSAGSIAQVFALYVAPWDAVLSRGEDQHAEFLSEWSHYHAGLLRLRHAFPGRLMLVNRNRLDDSAQLLLGEVASICGKAPDPSAEPNPDATPTADPMSTLRAKNFEWLAPEYWDIYEGLESSSWIGNGEPEYRDNLSFLDSEELTRVTAQWRRVAELPHLLDQSQGQLAALHAQAAAAEAELSQVRAEAEDSQHRVAQLQALYDQAQSLIQQAHADASAAAANHKKEVEELQGRIANAEAAMEEASRARSALESSVAKQANESKQREAELQATLKKQAEAAKQREAELQATLQKQADAAKQREAELQATLQKQTDAAKKREQELQASVQEKSKALEASQAAEKAHQVKLQTLQEEAKNATAEAEMLLEQLHQVQEALESTYIEGQEAAKKSTEVRATLEKEKAALSEQVKKVQSELAKSADAVKALTAEKTVLTTQAAKLQADLMAANGKAQAAEAAMKAKTDATATQEKKLQEQLAQIDARVEASEAQASKIAEEHKTAMAEAEKQRQALQAETTKQAAELARSTDQLSQMAAKLKAAEAELQRHEKIAAEDRRTLQEANASLDARATKVEAEAELQLLHLHQVQEELEQYFIRWRDATTALQTSALNFDRARQVVIRLAKFGSA